MIVLTWSNDRVEQLKKLWEAGASASQIACELGNVTRNAVIGKVHRLGLSGRTRAPSLDRPPRQRKPAVARFLLSEPRRPTRVAVALAEVVGEADAVPVSAYDNVVPIAQRLALAQLTSATCHWPIGDPADAEFFFCGGRALSGLPYCAHHSRIAYQPASDRRRKLSGGATRSGAIDHVWR